MGKDKGGEAAVRRKYEREEQRKGQRGTENKKKMKEHSRQARR